MITIDLDKIFDGAMTEGPVTSLISAARTENGWELVFRIGKPSEQQWPISGSGIGSPEYRDVQRDINRAISARIEKMCKGDH